MIPHGAKDLTAIAAALLPVALSAREAPISSAPYSQSQFRDDLPECVSAARLATDGIGVEGLADASRRVRHQSVTARHPLLARAHGDLREAIAAILRLTCDWNILGTDRLAVRMIENQRRALDVLTDLVDSLLTIAEPEMAHQPARLTDPASRSGGRTLREVSATAAPRPAEWSAAWSMAFSVDQPEVPATIESAPRSPCVLLIDENPGILLALRIYLLCAGYRVLAAANADQAFDRARTARISASLIDIIIVDFEFTDDDDNLAVIDKTRQLLGYNVPVVFLLTPASMDKGTPALAVDVSVLGMPVNVDELDALIGEVINRPRHSRLPAMPM
jgi:CheY-like chemotaxis protein